MATVIWKPIDKLYPYEVSNAGGVRRCLIDGTYKVLGCHFNRHAKQPVVSIKGHTYYLRQLVVAAFLPPRPSPRHYLAFRDFTTRCSAHNIMWRTRTESVLAAQGRFTDVQCQTIKKKNRAGMPICKLAAVYKCYVSTIRRAIRRAA